MNATNNFEGHARDLFPFGPRRKTLSEVGSDSSAVNLAMLANCNRVPGRVTCVAPTGEKKDGLWMHRFSIASKLDELSLLRDWVESTLRSSVVPRLTEEQIFQLQLAVQEAASNIISHSHCVDASPVVDVTLHFSEGKCQINLIYEGLAFDSAAVAPPSFDGSREGGFGVFIINELMDDVQYGRTAEHKNVIRLMKIVRSGEAQNHDRT